MTNEFKELTDQDLSALQSGLTTEFHRRDVVRQLQSVSSGTVDIWFKYVENSLDEVTGPGKVEFNKHFAAIKHFTALGLAAYHKDQQ